MSNNNSQVYQENLEFWRRAWALVKVPYTQLPDLPYLARIVEVLKPEGKVLDLGCGSGWLSIYLSRQGFDVTGVDVAENALALGKAWASQEGLSIDFQAQDITCLQFPKAYFSSIVANSIFEHLTYTNAYNTVNKLHHLLASGGIFFGCFDKVGTGPGQYYKLEDGSQVYTDKGRQGMLLRYFSDDELKELFVNWIIEEYNTQDNGSRILVARVP